MLPLVKNPLQDMLSSLNAVISTNESTQVITGHVIYNPAYTYKFQLKTTHDLQILQVSYFQNSYLVISFVYASRDLLVSTLLHGWPPP